MSNKTTHQELPHDLLAEKSLIGCLLVDGQSYDDISDLALVKEDFYHPKYGTLFVCIQDLPTPINQSITLRSVLG